MTSENLLLFRVTNWNHRLTRCSISPSQIVPYRIFYYLELFSSGNLFWPEIRRMIQSFFPYTIYHIYSVHSFFRCDYFLRVPKHCDVNIVWFLYTLHTPINSFIGYSAKNLKVSHLLHFHGPKLDQLLV